MRHVSLVFPSAGPKRKGGAVTILGPVLICLVLCVCVVGERGVKGWRLFPEFSFIQLPKQKAHSHTHGTKSESGHMCVSARSSRACVNKGSTGADPRLLFCGWTSNPLNCVTIFICASIAPDAYIIGKGGTELFHHSCGFLSLDWKKNSIFSFYSGGIFFYFVGKIGYPPAKGNRKMDHGRLQCSV